MCVCVSAMVGRRFSSVLVQCQQPNASSSVSGKAKTLDGKKINKKGFFQWSISRYFLFGFHSSGSTKVLPFGKSEWHVSTTEPDKESVRMVKRMTGEKKGAWGVCMRGQKWGDWNHKQWKRRFHLFFSFFNQTISIRHHGVSLPRLPLRDPFTAF